MLSFVDTAHHEKQLSICDDGLRRLALGLLLDAVKRAAAGDSDARAWLLSDGPGDWAAVLGLAWPPRFPGATLADALASVDARRLPAIGDLLRGV